MAPLVASPRNCTVLMTRFWRINQVMVDLCSANLDKTLLSFNSHVLMFTLYLCILFESATEVVFWGSMPTWAALANNSKCNRNGVSSSDYGKTHTHTRARAKDDTSPAGALTTACSLHVLANQVHSFIMNLQLLSKSQHCSRILPARCSFITRFLSPLGSAVWLSDCDSSIPGWQQRDQLAGEAWRTLQANAPRQQVTTGMRTWSLRAGSGEPPAL